MFSGRVEAHVGDFTALKDWTTEGEPELASRLSQLSETFRYSEASVTGDIAASAAGVSARNLKLVVDRSTLTGAVTYTLPIAGERGRLHVDLRSDLLDIDAAPILAASADWLNNFDLSLEPGGDEIADRAGWRIGCGERLAGPPGDEDGSDFFAGSIVGGQSRRGDDRGAGRNGADGKMGDGTARCGALGRFRGPRRGAVRAGKL